MKKDGWLRKGLGIVLGILLLCGAAAMAENSAPALTLEVEQPMVKIGEMFEATIGETDGETIGEADEAEYYQVRLVKNENTIYTAYTEKLGKIWVATVRAEAGEGYTLVAEACATDSDGKQVILSASESVQVTIDESSAAERTVALTGNGINYPNPYVGEYVYFSAYAPEADRVYLCWDGEEENSPTLQFFWEKPGTMTVSARAVYTNQDGSITTVESDPVTVTYQETAPAANQLALVIPDHVDRETGITLAFGQAQEGADGYYTAQINQDAEGVLYFRIAESTQGENEVYYGEITAGDNLVISGEELQALESGRAYLMEMGVYSEKTGYGRVYTEQPFTVASASEAGYEIRLLINGQDAVTEARRHDYSQRVQISAHPVDGADLVWLALIRGGETEVLSDWEEWNDWKERTEEYNIELEYGCWETTGYTVRACYVTEDGQEHWTESNTVLVRVTDNGQTLPPVSIEVPRTVTRGEMLRVRICEWPEEVEWFWMDVTDAEYEQVFHADNPEGGQWGWDVPTAQLEPGYYSVYVGQGAQGWQDGQGARVWFQVTESGEAPQAGEIIWSFSATTVETMQPFSFSIYAPGAAAVGYEMELDTSGWAWADDREGDFIWAQSLTLPNAGTLTITAHITNEEGEAVSESRTVNITATSGRLAAPELTAPGTFNVEEGRFTVSFSGVENAENYYLRIVRAGEEWNALYEENYEADEAGQTGRTITLEGDDLWWVWDSSRIRVTVEATAVGYDAAYAEAFTLIYSGEEMGTTVTLTVNEGTEDVNVISQERVRLVVKAPGASWLQIFNGYDWENQEFNEALEGVWTRDWDCSETVPLFARAWYDAENEEGGFFRYSNVVTVNVSYTGDGTVGDFTLTVPETVAQGSPLTVTLGRAEHGCEYHVRIRPEGMNGEFFFFDAEPGTLDLPTGMLEAGESYWVTVDARGEKGYGWGHQEARFTVTEPVSEPPAVRLSASGTELSFRQTVMLSVFAPGASEIQVYEKQTAEFLWGRERQEDFNDPEKGYAYDLWDFDAGEHQVQARAVFYDETGERREEWSDVLTIQVGEPAGKTDAPELEVSSLILTEGEDLTITMHPVEGADQYSFWMGDEDFYGGDQRIDGFVFSMEEAWTYTVPASYLKAKHFYRVSVSADKDGWESGYSEIRVYVGQRNVETGEVILTVDGSAEEEMTLPSSSRLHVKVSYEGEKPTVIRIRNGNSWEYWWGDDNFERDWNFGDDRFIMFAEASWQEIDFNALDENGWVIVDPDGEGREFDWNQDVEWTARTNAILMNITSPNGEMKAPEFELEKDAVAWGEDLVLTLLDEGPTTTDGEMLEDGWFYCVIEIEREGGWWDSYDYGGNFQITQGENRIPTYMLEPERRYRIVIGADGEGYSGSDSRTVFTVGSEPDTSIEPVQRFTVNGRTGTVETQTQENLRLIAYQTGAEWYNVEITRAGDEGWYDERNGMIGNTLSDEWRASEEGTYLLTAFAYGHLRDEEGNPFTDENGNTEWRDEIGRVTVTAAAPHGNLGDLQAHVSMPDKAWVGEKLTITFTELEGAEQYSYWAHDNWGNWLGGEERTGAGTLTLDTAGLSKGAYWVELDARAVGYNQAHAQLRFVLLEEPEGTGATVVIEEADLDEETGRLLVGGEIRYLVKPEAGKTLDAVRFYDGNNYWEGGEAITRENHPDWFTEDGSAFFWCNYNEERSYTVFAEAKLADSDQWITTNILTVETISYGNIGSFDFEDLTPITAARGDPVTFTFSEAEHATEYWADAFDRENGSYGPHSVFDGTTVTMSTANLPAGEYEIRGRAGSMGYIWRESDSTRLLTVTDPQIPESGILLTFSREEVTTQEQFLVSVYAPGAEAVRLCHAEPDNVWWTAVGDHGEGSHSLGGGAEEQTFYAYAMFDGQWSEPVTGTLRLVTDGDVPEAIVSVNATAVRRGDTVYAHVRMPEGAELYSVWGNLWRDAEDWNWPSVLDGKDYYEDESFEIETADLQEGDVIHLYVETKAYGKQSFTVEKRILITESAELGQITFTTPAALAEIGDEAFEGIAARAVLITEGVTRIGERAFADSRIRQIVIPLSVTSIADSAFDGCEPFVIFCDQGSYAMEWAEAHKDSVPVTWVPDEGGNG